MGPTTGHAHSVSNCTRRISPNNYIRIRKIAVMKRNSVFVLSVVCCLLSVVCSCKYSNEYQTINANNKFSIAVPAWMRENKSLKEGADFQYANRFRNVYVIGEMISKVGLKRTNSEIMNDNLNVLRKSLIKPVVSDSLEITVGNLKGTRVEIYGKMTGENIYFSEVLFEGTKNIYHLSIWTRSETRKLHFKEDINKIIASFREI